MRDCFFLASWVQEACTGCWVSGRYKCSKCSSKSAAITEYVLMLLGVLLLNLFLISQLSRATLGDFALVQGSDYLSVSSRQSVHSMAGIA